LPNPGGVGRISAHWCKTLKTARISISLPQELLEEIEQNQEKYQSFSGFCCSLLEKGLKVQSLERRAIEEVVGK
jgi:metal-responsive CopG/Arc/MetJ family transcriptional regulator